MSDLKRNREESRQRVSRRESRAGDHTIRADGMLSGPVAPWIEAFSGPRLHAVATVAIRARVPLTATSDTIQPLPTFSEAFHFPLAKLTILVPAGVQ